MNIQFSVAVHAYNSGAHIGETLQAILSQRYPAAEVIVVDDGSTDNTAEVIKGFGDRVSYHHIENAGCGAARKAAVERCQHDWIATCDSDDVWLPDHLERRAQLIARFPHANYTFSDYTSFGESAIANYSRLAEAPPGWVGRYTEVRDGEFILLKDAYRGFLIFNPAWPSGIAFRADAYRAMGGINPRYSRANAEDTDFSRRFLLLPSAVVAGDTQITWQYRRHKANMSAHQWRNILGKAKILEDHLRAGIIPSSLAHEVQTEAVKTRQRALRFAYWAREWHAALDIYHGLPHSARALGTKWRVAISAIRAKAKF